jgi:hypothetical protein
MIQCHLAHGGEIRSMGQPGPIAQAGQIFCECRAYPSSASARGAGRQFCPVFNFEIRDATELLRVIGHERKVEYTGVCRDEEIVRIDHRSTRFERRKSRSSTPTSQWPQAALRRHECAARDSLQLMQQDALTAAPRSDAQDTACLE